MGLIGVLGTAIDGTASGGGAAIASTSPTVAIAIDAASAPPINPNDFHGCHGVPGGIDLFGRRRRGVFTSRVLASPSARTSAAVRARATKTRGTLPGAARVVEGCVTALANCDGRAAGNSATRFRSDRQSSDGVVTI